MKPTPVSVPPPSSDRERAEELALMFVPASQHARREDLANAIEALIASSRADERERCARVAEITAKGMRKFGAPERARALEQFASAIRRRLGGEGAGTP